jgi:uncharacterized membrane protein
MIKIFARIGYVVAVLLALVGIISVLARFLSTVQFLAGANWVDLDNPVPGAEGFDARYYDHPYLTLVHVVTGFVFMALGPIQFWPAVRNRWIGYHRVAGRVWMIASLVGGISALTLVPMLPLFGNFSSQVAVTGAGSVFLVCLVQGYRRIRQRQIDEHREWMIRTFAIGLGISTFRVLLPMMMALGITFPEAWDTVAWLGFLINAIVAEVWINVTRQQPQTAPIHGQSRERMLQTS